VDRRTLFAVGSFVVSAILTAIGTFSGSDDNQFWQWLVILAVTAVAVAALFWVIVPRFDGGTGGAALVTAIVSVVSLAVFWIGRFRSRRARRSSHSARRSGRTRGGPT
jgi:O-antigen/teichoic acid export membrane protein